MRHLLLLRHAKAVVSSPDGDFARALAPRGRAQAEQFGRWLATQSFMPQLAMSSPAARAAETTDLVLAGLSAKPARVDERALYMADAEAILAFARAADAHVHSAMIVGHNPGLAELAFVLTGKGDSRARRVMAEKFPTCACAVLSFAGDAWGSLAPGVCRLEALTTPKSTQTSKSDA